MSHFKSTLQLRLLLVTLCSVPLISLSWVTDPDQKPFERTRDVFGCLTQIVLLADTLTKKPKVPD